jgi:hypothetical protein
MPLCTTRPADERRGLQRQKEHARPLIEASLQRSQSAAEAELRN